MGLLALILSLMRIRTYLTSAVVALVVLLSPSHVSAATISDLQAQIAALIAQIAALQGNTPSTSYNGTVSCSLSAPFVAQAGVPFTATWTTKNAVSADLEPTYGAVALNGSETITYGSTGSSVLSLTATGANGKTATCKRYITVTTPSSNSPTCSITSSKASVKPGETFKITWTTKNISHPWMDQVVKGGGEVAIAKQGSMTWTAEDVSGGQPAYDEFKIGEGQAGAVSNALCDLAVQILPANYQPTLTLTATPTTVASGSPTLLTWASTNANKCTLHYDSVEENVGINGGRSFSPTHTTTYTVNCVNDPGTGKDGPYVSKSATVTVAGSSVPAPICTLLTVPNGSAPLPLGDSITISWFGAGADYVILPSGDKGPATGRDFFTPLTDTTYTFKFVGPGGTTSCSKAVTVTGAGGSADTFTATPSTGVMPLTVTIKGTANAKKSCGGGYETLVYGDDATSAGTYQIAIPADACQAKTWTTTHTFTRPGQFIMSLYQGTKPSGSALNATLITVIAGASSQPMTLTATTAPATGTGGTTNTNTTPAPKTGKPMLETSVYLSLLSAIAAIQAQLNELIH